jgi:putative oxidoreductase
MKIFTTVVRLLMGLAFVVFGLNGFFNFIPAPPPEGVAATFMQATAVQSHFIYVPFAVQLIAGALLLIGRYVPLGIALLAPIIVNILDFHVTIQMSTIAPGILVLVLWIILFIQYRSYFTPLFTANASPGA